MSDLIFLFMLKQIACGSDISSDSLAFMNLDKVPHTVEFIRK